MSQPRVPAHHADEDIYVAIREAFDTTRRQLEDYVGRQRKHVRVAEVGDEVPPGTQPEARR